MASQNREKAEKEGEVQEGEEENCMEALTKLVGEVRLDRRDVPGFICHSVGGWEGAVC